MGPLELADLIGLDTVLSIAEVLHREFGDSKYRAAHAAAEPRGRGVVREEERARVLRVRREGAEDGEGRVAAAAAEPGRERRRAGAGGGPSTNSRLLGGHGRLNGGGGIREGVARSGPALGFVGPYPAGPRAPPSLPGSLQGDDDGGATRYPRDANTFVRVGDSRSTRLPHDRMRLAQGRHVARTRTRSGDCVPLRCGIGSARRGTRGCAGCEFGSSSEGPCSGRGVDSTENRSHEYIAGPDGHEMTPSGAQGRRFPPAPGAANPTP